MTLVVPTKGPSPETGSPPHVLSLANAPPSTYCIMNRPVHPTHTELLGRSGNPGPRQKAFLSDPRIPFYSSIVPLGRSDSITGTAPEPLSPKRKAYSSMATTAPVPPDRAMTFKCRIPMTSVAESHSDGLSQSPQGIWTEFPGR
jgi:hypothetical protein